MRQALPVQLNPSSRNSARPPSSAPPPSMRRCRPRRHRRRGGPPGPPGHTRPVVPGEDVQEGVGLKPAQCPHGQTLFAGDAPPPWRHQGMEMPPLRPMVTASPWPQLVWGACGEAPRASWPAGVPRGTDGPRVQATVARWTGASRVSKRTPPQAMAEVGGVPRRVGPVGQWAQAPTGA
jgi:transposase